MADVYLAFDMRRQARVAIKILREDLAEDPDFVRRFTREAQALARLDHPNIVRFYSFEQEGTAAFIVMDYVPGSNLQHRLKEAGRALPVEEVTVVLRMIGSALQYAHNEGYVHRDIKPGNIMLRDDGNALLSDFGIARATEGATATTVVLGTPAYMSPEQILGRLPDRRTDIYSLGIVLYEMVTGRRPFSGDEKGLTGTGTIARLREAHLKLAPPDPRQFNPDLSPGLAAVILRALAKNPEDRWPDIIRMVQAWQAATGVIPKTGAVQAVAGATPHPTSRPITGTPAPRASVATPRARTPAAGAPPAAFSPDVYPAPPPPVVRPRQRPRSTTTWVAVGGVLAVALIALALWRWILPMAGITLRPAPTALPADLPATASALVAANSAATAEAQAQASAAATDEARATSEAAAPWLTVTAEWRVATIQAQATAEGLAAEHATATVGALAAQQAQDAVVTGTAQAGRAVEQTATAAAGASVRAATTAEARSVAQAQATTASRATATAQAVVNAQATAARKAAAVAPTPVPSRPGIVVDFERDLAWRRGDQPYGQLDRSAEQVHAGGYAGRLRYDFPAVTDNFVVFLAQPLIALPGEPAGLAAWVYGDGSGHFLNAWIQDATDEVRQYTFGRITHSGWQQMVAPFDESRGWPNSHISGSDDGKLTYPVSLRGLVLDGVPDGQASSGVIYLDDIATSAQPVASGPAPPTPVAAAPGATPTAPAQAPAGLSGRIAFPVFAPDRGTFDVYVANIDGSNMQRVLDYASQPAFRPDGLQIALRRWKSDDRGIVVMDTYGGNRKRLTNFVEDALPAWAPNGATLVFLSRREPDRSARIYQVGAGGGGDWPLKRGADPVLGEYPSWLPGGGIIYRAIWPQIGIATMNTDGADMRMIFGDGSATAPAPFGQSVAFMSQRDGNWEIYRGNLDGSGLLRLTNDGANDGLPAWSPDGGAIAFVSNREGSWGVWVMNPDGGGQRKLFALPGPLDGHVAGEPDYSSRGWVEERISWGP